MKTIVIVGVALIVMGVAALAFDHYRYTTTERVLQIGPITASAEVAHTVFFPPFLAWLLIAGGVGALGFAALTKKN